MTAARASTLRDAMSGHFPEAMVVGHEGLIESMPNQEKDRHVAAAAVKAGAQVIVTSNLRDFRTLPDGIEAQSPDEFLSNLLDLDPEGLVRIVRQQARALRRPERSLAEVLRGLAKTVPTFAHLVARDAGVTLL